MGTSTLNSSVTTRVVRAVAAREGVAPQELQPPLYETINTEALDSLFHERTGQVTFEYKGYQITVDYANDVEVSVYEY